MILPSKPVLWITRRLSAKTIERAKRDYSCIVNEADQEQSADTIIAMSAKVDAILACHSEQFHGDVVERLDRRVKIIANHSVGTDHCDIAALRARGITVTNTPDVLSDATAELALLLMLGAARRAIEGDQLVRQGKWDFWSPSFMVGKQVSGARLGIIGMGRVGQTMARNARGLGMQIHYHNRKPLPVDKAHDAQFHRDLSSLLAQSDFLSLHCPATRETNGLMNAERFEQLPDEAVIVNTSRGSLIDEEALIKNLKSGKISAAGLDCFANEPGGNPILAEFYNVFMLPHIGSATSATRDAMGFRALDNLDQFFKGEKPRDKL